VVKLSPCLIKHHSINKYGKLETQLDASLSWEVQRGEWLALRCGCFTPGGKEFPVPPWVGNYVGLKNDLDICGREKNLPFGSQTLIPRLSSPQ
jgi:hypothetical protein